MFTMIYCADPEVLATRELCIDAARIDSGHNDLLVSKRPVLRYEDPAPDPRHVNFEVDNSADSDLISEGLPWGELSPCASPVLDLDSENLVFILDLPFRGLISFSKHP
ncbi:uncharacterized protein ARMOST_06123 [Armillaria ostoyae]|uniref:Uncharacterized protein n=1 Tax=Armillaria ostoyae TaxID=47428 RepID=A0A284R258_ARMOS|nr:uncharacterized protein ARMOST_06123 [Armillaria ostoyae]